MASYVTNQRNLLHKCPLFKAHRFQIGPSSVLVWFAEPHFPEQVSLLLKRTASPPRPLPREQGPLPEHTSSRLWFRRLRGILVWEQVSRALACASLRMDPRRHPPAPAPSQRDRERARERARARERESARAREREGARERYREKERERERERERASEREFVIDDQLVRIHFITEMVQQTAVGVRTPFSR